MARSGRSVTLSWVAPASDGGGGLCGYRVEMKATATGEWRLCHELVPGPECVVDGLAPGETYRFRVAAVGPAGTGEPVHLPQTVRLGESLRSPWLGRGRSTPSTGGLPRLEMCSLGHAFAEVALFLAEPQEPEPTPPAPEPPAPAPPDSIRPTPVHPAPTSPTPESRQVTAGEEVCLECEVTEAGEVIWLKGTELIQPSGHFQVLSQGQRQTLVIRGFSAEDQGEYRCRSAQDPTSPAAASFQGVSSGPSQGGGALGCGSKPAPPLHQLPRTGRLGEPASHQGRLRPGGEMQSPVAWILYKVAAQVTHVPEQDTGQYLPWYPLLVP